MSFPRYPKYKDSGVEWLGEVPEHWTLCALKHRIKMHYGDALASEVRQDGDVDVFGSNGVVGTHCVANTKSPAIVVGRKGSFGKIVWAERGGFVIDTAYSVDASTTFEDLRWAYYKLLSLGLDVHSQDTGVPGLAREKAYGIQIAVPTRAEQACIAEFLDRETAKIDELVAEQQRLIELLKEKRQAVISHAVTKGRNPHAPMKPSGIEWLGDVPAHWGVTKLSRLACKIGDGLHGTPEYVDESGFRFINGNNLVDGSILLTDTTRCVSEVEFKKHQIELNQSSLLLSINGTIGNLALYRGELIMLGKSAAFINCGERIARDFLFWLFQSSFMQHHFEYCVTGTTIFNLSLESIRNMPVPLPSPDEQSEIVARLAERTGSYDRMLREAQRAVNLLQERRTALISAAVTGQIDVRQLATKKEAA